jgi:hypothetical protein
MMVNNEFKQLRDITENKNGSVAHSGVMGSFKYGHKSRFLPYSREVLLRQGQVKCMLEYRNKY